MSHSAQRVCGYCLVLLGLVAFPAAAAVVNNLVFTDIDTTLTAAYARSSMIMDAAGEIHVAYIDAAALDVRYATQDGDLWAIEVLADGTALDNANIVARPDLALDADERPCVLYAEMKTGTNALVLATREAGVWSFDTVASFTDLAWDYRLAFDEAGDPHITYAVWTGSGMDLRYAVREADVWTDTSIGTGDQPALAIDAAGRPLVMYREWDGLVPTSLRLIRMTDSGWVTVEIPIGSASWPEMVLDDQQAAHVSYKSGSSVYYATNAEGVWVTTLIGMTFLDARTAALALDWQGLPVIVFPDQGHRLVLAQNIDGDWHSDFIAEEGFVYGSTPSCAFDRGVRLRLAYRGADGLRFAAAQQTEPGCAYAEGMPCPGMVSGNTLGWANFFTNYASSEWSESGSEQVWILTLPEMRTVTVELAADGGSNLDLFILDSCDPASCIAYGDTAVTALLEPGVWYIAVDGRDGAAGEYVLQVSCSGPVGIDWCNLSEPPLLNAYVGIPSAPVHGRARIEGVTGQDGATSGLVADLGHGQPGTDPATGDPDAWQWSPATFWRDVDGCDEFEGRITPWSEGAYDYCFRFSYSGGAWIYGDLDGSDNGYSSAQAGIMTVTLATAAPEGAQSLWLSPANPNPFNPNTSLSFVLPSAGHVTLSIYDAMGRRVARLLDEAVGTGAHRVEWTGVDDLGRTLPAGTYFCRLQTAEGVRTTKLALVR